MAPPGGINPGSLSRGERVVSWLALGIVVAPLTGLPALFFQPSSTWSLIWLFGPAAAMGVLTITAYFIASRRSRREVIAADYCLCTECRYPLAALPPVGTCPECGAAYTHQQVRECGRRTLDESWRDRGK